jgi:hypothetical protein
MRVTRIKFTWRNVLDGPSHADVHTHDKRVCVNQSSIPQHMTGICVNQFHVTGVYSFRILLLNPYHSMTSSSSSNEHPDIVALPSHPPPVRRLFLDTSIPVYHLGWLVTQQHLLSKYCPSVPVDIPRDDMLELIEDRAFKKAFHSRNSESKWVLHGARHVLWGQPIYF